MFIRVCSFFETSNLKGEEFFARTVKAFFFLFRQDLPTDIKKRNDYKKMCISSITSEFPEDCKFYPADTKDELHKVNKFQLFV